MKWTLAILVAVLAFMAMALLGDRRARTPTTGATPTAKVPSRAPPAHPRRLTQFRDGLELFKDGKYAQARQLFVQVDELMQPEGHPRARRYIEACDREVRMVAQRESAWESLRKGDLGQAVSLLDGIEEESLQWGEAEVDRLALLPLATNLEAVKDEDARGEVLKIIRDLAGEHERAFALVQAVWREVEKNQQAILETARELQASHPVEACRVAARGIALRPLYGTGDSLTLIALDEFLEWCVPTEAKGAVASSPTDAPVFDLAYEEFETENFAAAEMALGDIERSEKGSPTGLAARRLRKEIREFARHYGAGMTALNDGEEEAALEALTQAELRAREIRKEGRLHRQVAVQLGRLHTRAGMEAFDHEALEDAYLQFSKARAYDETNDHARQGMRRLKNRGKELFLEAYVQPVVDPVGKRRKYQWVIAFTPPDFEYHQKAKEQLAKLED